MHERTRRYSEQVRSTLRARLRDGSGVEGDSKTDGGVDKPPAPSPPDDDLQRPSYRAGSSLSVESEDTELGGRASQSQLTGMSPPREDGSPGRRRSGLDAAEPSADQKWLQEVHEEGADSFSGSSHRFRARRLLRHTLYSTPTERQQEMGEAGPAAFEPLASTHSAASAQQSLAGSGSSASPKRRLSLLMDVGLRGRPKSFLPLISPHAPRSPGAPLLSPVAHSRRGSIMSELPPSPVAADAALGGGGRADNPNADLIMSMGSPRPVHLPSPTRGPARSRMPSSGLRLSPPRHIHVPTLRTPGEMKF